MLLPQQSLPNIIKVEVESFESNFMKLSEEFWKSTLLSYFSKHKLRLI